ncbi:MAG: hypothetical protein QXP39_02245 [Candidatus Aenigmatarchaeota archaeon]
MKREIRRQFVHLSGLIFIIIAQFIGSMIFSWCFMIAFFMFVYLVYLRWGVMLHPAEKNFRKFILSFERETEFPLIGAFWFFFSMGLTFLLFPLNTASAACLILVVGDALATLIGKFAGRHKIGEKSIEGSLAFFFGSLTSWYFIGLYSIPVSVFATFVELIPVLVKNKKLKYIIDDNLLIPPLTAIFITIFLK